jgi:hypothetical protein
MSQLTKLALCFLAFLSLVTVLHGAANHRWWQDRERGRLTVAHLPVT